VVTAPNPDSFPTTPTGGVAGLMPIAQRLLLDILDTVRQPLLVLDPDFRVTQANKAFFRTFRVTPEATIGTVLFALGDGQWNIKPLREMLRDKLPLESQLEDFDVDHVFPGIGRKVMLLNARLVSHGPGTPRIILLAIEDVTTLRETDARLAAQRCELERSNAALDEYAAITSHDLQEPLRKIISFGDQLMHTTGRSLDPTQANQLERMVNAAGRMRTLIDDLLQYSQVSTRVARFVPTDLGRIARDVLVDLDTAISEASGRIELGELPVVDADALQMRQLLQNLIGNALKYRKPGTPSVVIVASRSAQGPRCAITVTDNGIGFKQEYDAKIFKMFERLNSRAQYGGSGIGLAICRRIVERHGGAISATSSLGNGATFTVTLPVRHVTQPTHGLPS
jgi:signal transduction histidine kinase